jgi:hypothetical protein
MECLKKIDSIDLFDRGIAIPSVILDSHGSRFGLDFLIYVNNESSY